MALYMKIGEISYDIKKTQMQTNNLLNKPSVFVIANWWNPQKKRQKEGTYKDLSEIKGEIKMTENQRLKNNKIIKKAEIKMLALYLKFGEISNDIKKTQMQTNSLQNKPFVFVSTNRWNPKNKWQKEGTYNDLSKMKGEIKMTEN